MNHQPNLRKTNPVGTYLLNENATIMNMELIIPSIKRKTLPFGLTAITNNYTDQSSYSGNKSFDGISNPVIVEWRYGSADHIVHKRTKTNYYHI